MQSPTKSFGTSGWTSSELKILEKLTKAYGTDRSKILRQLVRNADKKVEQVIAKLEQEQKEQEAV